MPFTGGSHSGRTGATLIVSPHMSMWRSTANQAITDDGFANRTSVPPTRFVVRGRLSLRPQHKLPGQWNHECRPAPSSTAAATTRGSLNTQIVVNSGGELTASSSTFNVNNLVLENGSVVGPSDFTNDAFNLPVSLPALDIPMLANNLNFQAIEIFGGSLSSGQSLSLNLIGTASTANLVYVFTGGFTVATGATLIVSPHGQCGDQCESGDRHRRRAR